MSVSLAFYDPSTAESNSHDALPEGIYKCIIVGSQKKATKAGTGHYLEFKLQVIEGGQQGNLLTDRFNLWNPNQKAVDIARGQLKGLYEALGKGNKVVNDSQELHNIPVLVKVTVTDADANGNHWNEIKGYRSATKSEKSEKISEESLDKDNPWA